MSWAIGLLLAWAAGGFLVVAFVHGCRVLRERSRGMR